MTEPDWLRAARNFIGIEEIPGDEDNDIIVSMFADCGHSWVKDDETAWCAAFVGSMLKRSGVKGTGKLNARSYLDWGLHLSKPEVGCIVVLKRGTNPVLGHVGFWIGENAHLVDILGGNQSNGVNVKAYKAKDILGYRWPKLLKAA